MDLEQALSLLSKIAKGSEASDGNRHLNLSLVGAEDRNLYIQALAVAQNAVANGIMSQDDLRRTLQID